VNAGEANDYDLAPEEDVLDIDNNPLSHKFDDMITKEAEERRGKFESILNGDEQIDAPQTKSGLWFD
jgi:hypothetical protein